ncbi:MAG: helix-turn-helix transcriptional regulator [Selenomonadaceae bacterium]|nr:helix-turn-helix transcriptional regulator [Selenomonadaceae bacterium]
MDSNINLRIKMLRKNLGLSQDDFGNRIGLKHGAISKIEKSGNTVIDQNIRLICDTFHASEEWLRTGKGDMYEENNETLLKQLAAQYNLEGERLELIRNFLLLTIEQQEAICRAVDIAVEANLKARKEAARKAADAGEPPTAGELSPVSESDTPPTAEPSTIAEDEDSTLSKRPEGLSDEEWNIVQHLRMEKNMQTPTASSSTEPA